VDQLFAGAETVIAWASDPVPGAQAIQLVIRSQPDLGPGASKSTALAVSIGQEPLCGGSLFVFYERVLAFALRHNHPVHTILAYVIAHEIGHILLPKPAHAPFGLMKGEWDDKDLRRITASPGFSPEQIAAMRARQRSCQPRFETRN